MDMHDSAYCHHHMSSNPGQPREGGSEWDLSDGDPDQLFVNRLQACSCKCPCQLGQCAPAGRSPRGPPSASLCLLEVSGSVFLCRSLTLPHLPLLGHCCLPHAGFQADHMRITDRNEEYQSQAVLGMRGRKTGPDQHLWLWALGGSA